MCRELSGFMEMLEMKMDEIKTKTNTVNLTFIDMKSYGTCTKNVNEITQCSGNERNNNIYTT